MHFDYVFSFIRIQQILIVNNHLILLTKYIFRGFKQLVIIRGDNMCRIDIKNR